MTSPASTAQPRKAPSNIHDRGSPAEVPAVAHNAPRATSATGETRCKAARARGPGWGRAAATKASAAPTNRSKARVSVP